MTPAPGTFPVTLHFLSDWHVGTGEGRVGVVDALVRRDADGLPFVPAKTLLGVWRDACETVADTLGAAQDSDLRSDRRWSAWVDWLFGSQPGERNDLTAHRDEAPVPAALSLTSARLSESLRDAVCGRPELVEAMVLLRPGVALDHRTGTALEDLLRLEERALGGMVLEATASVPWHDGGLPRAAELLLRAGARFVESLGGKRNRGTGRLVIEVGTPADDPGPDGGPDGGPDARLAALLADDALLADPGSPPRSGRAAAPVLADGRLDGSRRRCRWRLELEAISPVVIVDRVVGNDITTRGEIPGTALLPAILAALPDSSAVGLDDVRVGDAVPAVADADGSARPAWAEPMVWHRDDKGQADRVVNAAQRDLDPASRPKPARQRAARIDTADGPRWQECVPGTAVSTHAVVNDVHRRPTADAGGLFSYHGMEAGTLLVSDLVLPDSVRLTLAEGDVLRVGRSRKDDYGQVRVRRLIRVDEPAPRPVGADGLLRVWLVSDVLLRDERLAYDPSPQRLGTVLGDRLGLPLPLEPVTDDGDRRPTMTQPVRREGFAPRWGRPRTSRVGLKAGSVITFRMTPGTRIDPDTVIEVERDGIGDRVVEGFGRLLLDPPELLTTHPDVARRPRTPTRPGTGADTDADARPALDTPPHPVELAAWRRRIRRTVAEIVTGAPGRDEALAGLRKTSRAQRGVLRAQVERLALPGGERLVDTWLKTLDRSRTRRDDWDPGTRKELRKLLLGDEVWNRLGLAGPQKGLVLAPGREDLLRRELTHEAVAVLVDELVRHAHADEEAPAHQEVRA